MKNQLSSMLLTTLLVTGGLAAHSQQPLPPAPENPANHGPGKPLPPPQGERKGGPQMPDQQITKLTVLSGMVNKAISNDRFEYNGFILNSSGSSVTVTYPPHLGEKIFNLAKSGTSAKVTGFYRSNPQGTNEFHLVNLEVNGTMVTDTPPVQPAVLAAQQQSNLNSTIKELRYTPNKEVNGFILSSGEVIGLPPHIAQQLGSQLKTGEKVGVTGFTEPKRQGVVYSQNLVFIKAQTLTLNGQAYLVR